VTAQGLDRGRALALLALLVVCGAGLRLARLDHQSLWLDELASWHQSAAPSAAGVIARVREDVHAPAHSLVLFAVQRCCGDTETWLRLPSALAGVLTIPALYAFVRRLYGRREGLFAALLLAFGGTPILYSQTARPYALLLLGACAGGACWLALLRALRGHASVPRAAGAGFVAAAVATAYTHYFGALLVALQCAALLALAPRRAAPWVAAIAVAGLPWLPAVREDTGLTRIWIREPQLATLAATWRTLFRRPGGFEWLAGAACVAWLAHAGALAWRRRHALGVRDALLAPTSIALLWLVLPVAIAFGVSRAWLPIYTPRNLLIVLPAAYALVARALTAFVPARAHAGLAVALALVLLAGLWTGHYYTRIHSDQFREAAAVVAAHEHETPGAVVWVAGVPGDYFDYYLAHLGAQSRADTRFHAQADPLRALLDAGPEWLWLLAGRRPPADALRTALEERYEPVREHAFYRASARLYRRR
jgi:uncharacterized membrane protein